MSKSTDQADGGASSQSEGRSLTNLRSATEGKATVSPAALQHSEAESSGDDPYGLFGSLSEDFVLQQVSALTWATRDRSAKAGAQSPPMAINSALAFVSGVRPKNELEAVLAVQMAGTHALTMEMLGRAKATERTDHLQLYGNMAVKLQRTFAAQIEALARLRGKAQQTVRVEHVTVEAGAQAVIGDIRTGG